VKWKKLTTIALAGIMALQVAACGKTDTQADPSTTPGTTLENSTTKSVEKETTTTKKEETTTPAQTTPVATTPAETTVPKTEGELLAEKYTGFVETPMDLGGRTIRIVSNLTKLYVYQNDAEGNPDPGRTANDTLEVVEAIKSIEKDYNCKIEFEQLKGGALVEALLTAQSAGDAYCDILEFGVSGTYIEQIYSANLCIDVNDDRIKDIIRYETNPWLPASDFALWNGKQLGVHFKTNNTGDIIKAAVLVNKDLLANYGYKDVYQFYRDKTWTFDKFEEMCASIAAQSDGKVLPVIYGKESLFVPVLIYANGGEVATYKDGKYMFTGLTDNVLEAVNYAVDLKAKGYIHEISDTSSSAVTKAFANGEAVFYFGIYNELKKYTKGEVECNYEIGLMPGPLGPSGNGEYNAVTYTESMFHVMENTEKPEEVAAILVALANRTGKHDMIETELMNTLQDEESAEVLQLMYDRMICDFSRSISKPRSLIMDANKSSLLQEKTPKEAYEEVASQIQAYFDEYNTSGTITKVETAE